LADARLHSAREKASQTGCETLSKAIVVMDASYVTLKEQSKQIGSSSVEKSVSK